MKVSKLNSAFYEILFVMIPFNWIDLQQHYLLNIIKYPVIISCGHTCVILGSCLKIHSCELSFTDHADISS